MPKGERASAFDAEGFFASLDAVRERKKLSWRKVADEAGVSASTLTRMGQGRRPDVDSLAALASWGALDLQSFTSPAGDTDSLSQISVLLRRDPNLSQDAAKAIDGLIQATYSRLSK